MRERQRLEDFLPGLIGTDYEITSPRSRDYNCIAWALGEDDRSWNPFETGILADYWPAGIARDDRVSTVKMVFAQQGFLDCDSEELEPEFEKIAMFGDEGEFVHVALQLPNGRWTSKLGKDHDIEHGLRDLVGRRSPHPGYRYGEVVGFMKRPRE